MAGIIETYLQYGVPSDLAAKYASIKLAATTFKATPLDSLLQKYGVNVDEATLVKQCLKRSPIDEGIVQALLENNNFVCCCCKGVKSDSYIIHHIVEYEKTQDNSYENLAVICPNDHDLAHAGRKLTNKLTADQIRQSKARWEQQVKIQNLAIASPMQRTEFILKLPKYQQLQSEIDILQDRISDKEKVIARSEAYFNQEVLKLRNDIAQIELQKVSLEKMVEDIVQKLRDVDFSNASATYSRAVSKFLDADLLGAIEGLNEAELDAELEKAERLQKEADDAMLSNAESRILRAKLLTLNFEFNEANQSAGRALRIYETLAERDCERYAPVLANALESVGTIYFNAGLYDAAEQVFCYGLDVCQKLQDDGNFSQVHLIPLLLQNIGASHYSRQQYELAREYLENANAWYTDLSKVYENVEKNSDEQMELTLPFVLKFQQERAMAITNLGTTYLALGLKEKAEFFLIKGIEIYKDLADSHQVNNSDGEMKNLYSLASFYNINGDLAGARNALLQAISITEELFDSQRSKYIEQLADGLLDIGSICLRSQESDEARCYFERALILYRELVSLRGETSEIQMAWCLMYLAIIYGQEPEKCNEAIEVAAEAALIGNKYPDNPECEKLCNSALQFIDAVKGSG